MKGVVASPHVLQIIILGFSFFYLSASCTQFFYNALTNCHYVQNGHDDVDETAGEYSTLCIGNSITALSYGIVSSLTLIGIIYSLLKNKDSDILISFVIFGIMVAYLTDLITNLRINCIAGDTTDQNAFDDDSFDSAKSECKTLTYGLVLGIIGVIGGFIGGYYGILMKLNHGKFYIQRPIGLFIAVFGYGGIFGFTYLSDSYLYCHYYHNGQDQLPIPAPFPPIQDDVVYNQLSPLCTGYTNAAYGYMAAGVSGLLGVPAMLLLKKRGVWLVFCIFCALGSSANYSNFTGAKLVNCDNKSNFAADHGAYNSYEAQQYSDGCQYWGHAVIVSLVATTSAGLAAIITGVDCFVKNLDHDSLVIRCRRALLFAYGLCFTISQNYIINTTLRSDCKLYLDQYSDDEAGQGEDLYVQRVSCNGKIAQSVFYYLSMIACGVGMFASLYFNFPDAINDKAGLMDTVEEFQGGLRLSQDSLVKAEQQRLISS